MTKRGLIQDRIHRYYWMENLNCAVTTLRILGEVFGVSIPQIVEDAAVGMHGAGGYRAQCGLVEGALMFIGIAGRASGLSDEQVADLCWRYAAGFEERFGSLQCRVLRPQGFNPDDPQHLCEPLTQDVLAYDVGFVADHMPRNETQGPGAQETGGSDGKED